MRYWWFSKNSKFHWWRAFFDHTQPKTYKLFYKFLESIFACHKSSWFINSHLRYGWFKNSVIWLGKNILTPPKENFQIIFLQSVSVTALRLLKSDWLIAILTFPKWRFSNHLLSSFNLSQHARNHSDWPTFSWDMADLGLLKSDSLRAILTTSN